ncbi:MAG: hypothetical protein ACXV3T_05630 [Halobacteriota archaeon]
MKQKRGLKKPTSISTLENMKMQHDIMRRPQRQTDFGLETSLGREGDYLYCKDKSYLA